MGKLASEMMAYKNESLLSIIICIAYTMKTAKFQRLTLENVHGAELSSSGESMCKQPDHNERNFIHEI